MSPVAHRTVILLCLAALLGLAAAPCAATEVSFLYNLSDLTGTVPYGDVRLHVDQERDEIYVAEGNRVKVFNHAGMEIYGFDVPGDTGRLLGLAVDDTGDILLLTSARHGQRSGGRPWNLIRCDYRGVPTGQLAISGFPPELAEFDPNHLFHIDGGRLVLVSSSRLLAATLDRDGAFLESLDIAEQLAIDRADNDLIFGVSVEDDGSMLMTFGSSARVYVIEADGEVRSFGRYGSNPGAFGVIDGIARDDAGNVIVADKLRGVVLVFDEEFRFLSEFGTGAEGAPLARPTGLATAPDGKIYVTQSRSRGVAVFKLRGSTGRSGKNADSAKGGAHLGQFRVLAKLEQATENEPVPARPTRSNESNIVSPRAGATHLGSGESTVAALPAHRNEESKQ
jgi:sugar lactone lactonase YvrE